MTFRQLWIQRTSLCWIAIFWPPDVSAGDTRFLYSALESVLVKHPKAVLLGDLNLRDITWQPSGELGHPLAENSLSFEFPEICVHWDLKQLVTEPTRGNSCLDLILASHPQQFDSVTL